MNIGERIKRRRNELGLSQRELASRMNYQNHSTVGKIENGKVDIPQSKIEQFARVLGVSIAYLMNWEETQQKNDAIADIVIRLRTDEDFLSAVELLNNLDADKIAGVKQMLNAFIK